MNSADIITSFFNNELSPDQEREFLLTVAASDSMRLGLKSHVMLDKILQEENQEMLVSPGVRRSIMREAAVVAAVAGAGASEASAAPDGSTTSSGSSSSGFFTLWKTIPAALLVAVGSFFLGYNISDEEQSASVPAMVQNIDAVDQVAPFESRVQVDGVVIAPVRGVAERLEQITTPGVTAGSTPVVSVVDEAEISRNDNGGLATSSDGPASVESSNPSSAIGRPTVDGGTTVVKRKQDN